MRRGPCPTITLSTLTSTTFRRPSRTTCASATCVGKKVPFNPHKPMHQVVPKLKSKSLPNQKKTSNPPRTKTKLKTSRNNSTIPTSSWGSTKKESPSTSNSTNSQKTNSSAANPSSTSKTKQKN